MFIQTANIALVPEYFVFRSQAVFCLFVTSVVAPIVAVAIYRERIPRQVGILCLVILAVALVPIGISLWHIAARGAIAYWTTWCTILLILSSIGSLWFLRRDPD